MLLAIAIGFVSGIISGMGIGGGTVLIPALVFLIGMEQQQAQSVNLIYFVPTAIIAIFTHMKQGNIDKKVAKPLALYGIIGAVCGAMIAVNLNPSVLRKFFGGFLLIMGIYEFNKKEDRGDKRAAKYKSERSKA